MIPKVSVIIPTYNRAADVPKAVESVLGQTFSDLEVIVVDDGSKDETGKILAEIYGDRIRYIAQANQGVSAARNRGLAEARGEWVAFLDSDDLWDKEKLEWQFKALEQFGPQCGACYTDVRLMNHPETRTFFQMADQGSRHEKTMDVDPDVLEVLVRPGGAGMVVCLSSLVARADIVKKTGVFDLKLGFYADSEFMFRLAMATSFCYVNRPLVWFDRSPAGSRHAGSSEQWDKMEFVLEENQVRLEGFLRLSESLPTKVVQVTRETLGSVHSGLTNCHLEAGRYQKAREAVSKAVRLDLKFNTAVKWLLTWISPQLAVRTVRRHRRREEANKDALPII